MSITVYGTPAPQGSKRHVGKGIMVESSKKLRPWREAVKYAALEARDGAAPLDGPIIVRMVFTMLRSNAAKKRARPHCTPDLSKLARATEDALTDAGVWVDDARVVEYQRLAKVFPNSDEEAMDAPGVRITIQEVSGAA
jgi:Holliday junction resolvase RusA-like endonuclease